MCAPKGVGPVILGYFSCKEATYEDAVEGPKVPIMDPAAAGASSRGGWRRRSCPRCGSTSP
jgi:hypothetical protein